jgi:hypothetical protein
MDDRSGHTGNSEGNSASVRAQEWTVSTSEVLAQIIGEQSRRPQGPPPVIAMPAILAAAQQQAGPPLKIRRFEAEDGPAFWRWDCANCGEYGGGRHHPDAVSRAMRHCAEHPEHRSSLLPPALCRQRDNFLPAHPMLYAVDDDAPPPPLSI